MDEVLKRLQAIHPKQNHQTNTEIWEISAENFFDNFHFLMSKDWPYPSSLIILGNYVYTTFKDPDNFTLFTFMIKSPNPSKLKEDILNQYREYLFQGNKNA